VQLPVPKHIDSSKVLEASAGQGCGRLPSMNVGALVTGNLRFAPVPLRRDEAAGKMRHGHRRQARVVVGRSNIVGSRWR